MSAHEDPVVMDPLDDLSAAERLLLATAPKNLDQADREARRRLQNRLAAQSSRTKRKNQLCDLTETTSSLESRLQQSEQTVQLLRQQCNELVCLLHRAGAFIAAADNSPTFSLKRAQVYAPVAPGSVSASAEVSDVAFTPASIVSVSSMGLRPDLTVGLRFVSAPARQARGTATARAASAAATAAAAAAATAAAVTNAAAADAPGPNPSAEGQLDSPSASAATAASSWVFSNGLPMQFTANSAPAVVTTPPRAGGKVAAAAATAPAGKSSGKTKINPKKPVASAPTALSAALAAVNFGAGPGLMVVPDVAEAHSPNTPVQLLPLFSASGSSAPLGHHLAMPFPSASGVPTASAQHHPQSSLLPQHDSQVLLANRPSARRAAATRAGASFEVPSSGTDEPSSGSEDIGFGIFPTAASVGALRPATGHGSGNGNRSHGANMPAFQASLGLPANMPLIHGAVSSTSQLDCTQLEALKQAHAQAQAKAKTNVLQLPTAGTSPVSSTTTSSLFPSPPKKRSLAELTDGLDATAGSPLSPPRKTVMYPLLQTLNQSLPQLPQFAAHSSGLHNSASTAPGLLTKQLLGLPGQTNPIGTTSLPNQSRHVALLGHPGPQVLARCPSGSSSSSSTVSTSSSSPITSSSAAPSAPSTLQPFANLLVPSSTQTTHTTPLTAVLQRQPCGGPVPQSKMSQQQQQQQHIQQQIQFPQQQQQQQFSLPSLQQLVMSNQSQRVAAAAVTPTQSLHVPAMLMQMNQQQLMTSFAHK